MPQLSVQIEPAADHARVVLKGDLTEDADFSAVLGHPGRSLVIDLADVRRINSCGVREWVKLLQTLAAEGRKLVLERCSVAMVRQLNQISNFAGAGEIRSLFAPYLCESCGFADQRLLPAAEATVARLDEPVACPGCSAPMVFDDLPAAYLAFKAQPQA